MLLRDPRPAADVLRHTGLDGADLLALEGLAGAEDSAVYLSGSLAEGIGNDGSDIDVYVVGSRAPSGPNIVASRRIGISVHMVHGRRVDFEYWPDAVVDDVCERLDSLRIGREFLGGRFDLSEEQFVHRLGVGIPLTGIEKWRTLRERVDREAFRGYLEQQAIHLLDGTIDDLDGMLRAGDLEVVAHRARDVVGYAVDVHRHHCGDTNPTPKWRAKVLARLPASERTDHVRERYRELTFGALDTSDECAVEAYLTACAAFAHRVVRWAQG
jgi:predicted nucleotidyltransferase